MPNELPKRKKNRLEREYYSLPGSVFLTICTHQRKKILSNIVGAIHESPAVQLTRCGKMIDTLIGELQRKFPITVDQYVIMPNHIHLIITVKDCDEVRAIRESPLQKRSIISQVVGYLKMNATKQIHTFMSGVIFQRSFFDHVIRNEQEYAEISKYVAKNPQTWHEDSLYCEGNK